MNRHDAGILFFGEVYPFSIVLKEEKYEGNGGKK
jgi:hypothetical protein